MATTALLSLSFPPATAARFSGHQTSRRQWQPKLTVPLSSPSTVSAVEEDPETSSGDDAFELPLGGCKGCGNEVKERGCNGEGRIQGGIATVPGFGWWPIKAYRPCPGFLASGGRYKRQGQSMDEVAFGGGRGAPVGNSSDVKSSKKKKGSKKSK